MIRLSSFTPRMWLILAHDLLATAAAIIASFFIRFEASGIVERWELLAILLPPFVLFSGLVYGVSGLYRAKWRFTSLPELFNIVRASTVLALTLLAIDYVLLAPNLYGTFFFGKITIVLYWVLQTAFLAGPRVAYRYFRYTRTLHHTKTGAATPALIVGFAADADVLLRAIENGAVTRIRPVGILSPSLADRGQMIRGVSVLGEPEDIERVTADLRNRDINVARVVLTPSVLAPEAKPEAVLMRARRLGLATSRLPSLDAGGEALTLAPVQVEDLLLRPGVKIDYRRLEAFVDGKAIVVTGGGGSIGAEICERVATFGARRLLIIENSEPALHSVLEMLTAKSSHTQFAGRLADIRDRARIMRLISDFQPDIVFHAAALKHVPLLEQDWGESIKTNVFGSINVADAALEAGATAMVFVSTDKAIEPVSVLGACKRFAEMYCQAVDQEIASERPAHRRRLISVRFGNVLASNGSVVPKFKAQIEAGGPLTVTHPEMVRYFMTIREACDLVVTAASHALAPGSAPVAVYVLNMGQPVKIVDLAERMIRLSGLEPGRDIDIAFTGIRPGERLNEILFAREEPMLPIGIDGIVAAKATSPSLEAMRRAVQTLEHGLAREDRGVVFRVLRETLPELNDGAMEAGEISAAGQKLEATMQPEPQRTPAPARRQSARTSK
jgi:FlaA1/EpsC-like NDP-sugar epimerase